MKLTQVSILALASLVFSLCLQPSISHASQPPMEPKGTMYQQVVQIADTLQPDDKLLIWMDIRATESCQLPADPNLYGIKWITITYDPDIEESQLLWCLAEIPAGQVESMIEIPWVFDMSLIRVGGLQPQAAASPKFSVAFQEATDRALQQNAPMQVVLWIENATGRIRKSSSIVQGIGENILNNVTSAIEQAGGELLKDYYAGSYTLSASLPPSNLSRIAENPFIRKLYLNGPVVPEGFDDTARLYNAYKGNNDLYMFRLLLIWSSTFLFATVAFERKARKKTLTTLTIAIVISVTLASQITPAAHALDVSTTAVRAHDVWATGNAGAGVNVAVLDVGFDVNHNDIAPAIVHTINAHDWTNNVGQDELHGTHVAGIVAGRGVNNLNFRGVAWDAGLVLVKIEGDADFEPAIRWVINNRAQFNIRAITMSLRLTGVGPGGDGLESPASIAMDDAVENGIVTIKSAGNIGDQGAGTITSPGNAFNIITVGATNDMNTANINDDELADYPNGYTYKGVPYGPWGSSRGPTEDGRPKPDVVAPGVHVWSCRAANTLAGNFEDVTADGFYGELSGTSMAAPHVAGTVALMLNANPDLTPAQTKAILKQTAKLNTNLSSYTVNERGHGLIDAYDAVQLAQNLPDLSRSQMYDSWDVRTPNRQDILGISGDYLTFTVSGPSSTYGIPFSYVEYHFWDLWGAITLDYRLLFRYASRHVWIDNTYYDLGTYMANYLFSAPRIYEEGDGYVLMRALYRVDNVFVEFLWKMHVDEIWLKLNYIGGSSWRTLIYIDPDVWDSTNYAYLPSTEETILYERRIPGDVLLDIRDPEHTEYLQIDPESIDNPMMWVLRYGYFGNDPSSALNSEYIYNRDIIVYYQATSYVPDPGPSASRKTNPIVMPDPTQNDAYTGDDARNNFNQATYIDPGSYTGILCYSDPEDTKDWYKFPAEDGAEIYVSLTPPSGIDFDLELYDPAGNLKAGSYLGAGCKDSVTYTADSSGHWRARFYIYSGEAKYSFSVSNHTASGGGCPILYVYDGKEYVSEGLLDIHNPEGIDLIVNHTLITEPKQVEAEYRLRLTEHHQTASHIDRVTLFAILKDKTLVDLPLLSAVHSECGDVLPQLLLSDDWKIDTWGADHNNGISQSIDLRFETLPSNVKVVGFIFRIEGNNAEFMKW